MIILPSVHVDARFPCGHMLHVELRGFLFLPTGAAHVPDGPCPIHGKDCRPAGLGDILGLRPIGAVPMPPAFMQHLQAHAQQLGNDLQDNQPKP